MDSNAVDNLKSELTSVRSEAVAHFESLGAMAKEQQGHLILDGKAVPVWNLLTNDQRDKAHDLRSKVAAFGVRLLEAVRISPLMEQADEEEIRTLLRKMSASLALKSYEYTAPQVVSDEDRVLGMVPAEQNEHIRAPIHCVQSFDSYCNRLRERMQLLAPPSHALAQAIVSTQMPAIQKYRPNTAFIMMQIDEKQPKLEDVKNCIKEVFKEFGIEAVRSDEIEHSDVVTQRILDEITTSEFQIADLTGERPSVYYELGYAHAAGKRPILFREEGTRLHFDLLVHNVPAYKNTTDLKAKLRARLSAMLGRAPGKNR
jgi:hypothetical protein